ncbi:MAG: hypothetical protein HGA67_01645 [Candidatus Yonathbacteria bacterium]|nr:hypothetical protein [Candidatus Yonathbacteria bacterium]
MRNFRLGFDDENPLLEMPLNETRLPQEKKGAFLRQHTIIIRRDEGLLTLKNHIIMNGISCILIPFGGLWLVSSWVLLLVVLIPFPPQYHVQEEITLAAVASFGIGFISLMIASHIIGKLLQEYRAGYPSTFKKEKLN